MKAHWMIRTAAVAAIALGGAMAFSDETAPTAAAPTTAAPTTAPAGGAAMPAATVSPEARQLIDQASQAYGNLKTLTLSGTFAGDILAAGQKQGGSLPFTAAFAAPNKFRHTTQNDILINCNGEKAIAYSAQSNVFARSAAPKEKVATRDLPEGFSQIIIAQDPSLRLALAKDPAGELTSSATDIAKIDNVQVGKVACPAVKMTMRDKTLVTLAFDPQTHLLRQVTSDIRPQLESRGIPNVQKAQFVVDYATSELDGPLADPQFVFDPPAGARDIKDLKPAAEDQSPAEALAGKDAPPLKLKGMDDKEVSLADLKGKVVILDFWATWCGPCRQSLPHLDKLYQEKKGDGLVVYAVNEQETKDKVQAFVDKTKLSVPILFDSEGKAGESYKADGIPETVVVGKDGKVAKVFVGFNPGESPEALKAAVEEAMKK